MGKAFSGKRRAGLVQVGVSLAVLAALVAFATKEGDALRQLHFNGSPIPAAAVLLLASLLARALRWHLLMKWSGVRNLPLSFSAKILMVSTALNIFMPAGSGDVAKSYFGYRWTGIKEKMLAVSFYDKLIALGALLPFGLLAFHHLRSPWILGVSFALLVPLLMVEGTHFPRVQAMVERGWNKIPWLNKRLDITALIEASHFSLRQKVMAYSLSVIGWIFSYSMLWLAFRFYDKLPPLSTVLSLSPVMTLGRLFPFTLNGIGTDEAIILFLFRPFVQPDLAILASALVYRVILLMVPGMAGLAFIVFGRGQVR